MIMIISAKIYIYLSKELIKMLYVFFSCILFINELSLRAHVGQRRIGYL